MVELRPCIEAGPRISISMIRKLFVRLFLCCIALVGTLVVCLCIAGYLALQKPTFYSDRLAQPFSCSDQLAANASFQNIGRDLQRWTDRSVALQHVQSLPEAAKQSNASLEALPGDYDPNQDTHSISVSEK